MGNLEIYLETVLRQYFHCLGLILGLRMNLLVFVSSLTVIVSVVVFDLLLLFWSSCLETKTTFKTTDD